MDRYRTCVACKHFGFDAGWAGTEITPGDNWSMECGRGHYVLDGGLNTTEDDFRTTLRLAALCPDFAEEYDDDAELPALTEAAR